MTASIPDARQRVRTDNGERAPENVAPVVAYLASTRSDWCNGQVIHASGYQVGLYNRPQVIRQVASDGPWDLDRLSELVERSFQPAVGSSTPAG
jgi:hypothetical protein